MKTIGVLFGMENSFPGALVEHINARNLDGIRAEFVETGAVHLDKAPRYSVIVDRISHDIPFYRAYLKHAALNGTIIGRQVLQLFAGGEAGRGRAQNRDSAAQETS
jgi:hypothetical protein